MSIYRDWLREHRGNGGEYIDAATFAKMNGITIEKALEEEESIITVYSHHDMPTENKSVGLGDTIAKITSAVGIQPCGGCKSRQEWLNKVFPYGDK